MEFSADIETHLLGAVPDLDRDNYKLKSSDVVPETDSGIISVQLLEFKTSLLEAVEELYIHRDAETRHEAQVCKLVLEKQELEWQKESLQNQISRMTNERSESLTAVRKQAQIQGIEEEKGKHQLSAELKDKEISSLKEELKSLQLSKYSSEKKLSELEQKVQLQSQVRDSHLNQLGEVEKRFRTISRQCAVVRQVHEKLEQNVEEAMRINEKIVSINKKQESTIAALKKDVERLNSELVKSKVVSICRSGDKSAYCLLKAQELQELKHRLTVETELNKKMRNEIAVERAEKKELMHTLQHAQELLQTQTQAVSRTEQQLHIHTEEYQVLKREHEMVREMSKEKEDRLVRLIDDYKRTKTILEEEIETLHAKMQADQEELKAVKKSCDHLHEKHQQRSSLLVHQAREIHGLEKDDSDIQTNSPTSLNCDIDVDRDTSLDGEACQASPRNNCEHMRHCKEDEDIPDERTAECQEAAIGGENDEVNVRSQMDRTTLALLPSEGLEALAPDQSETSERVGGTDVTNQQIDPAVKQEAGVRESAPVLRVFANGSPSDTVQSYTEICLAKLSEPQTRSVYGVASDPVTSEPRVMLAEMNLCVYERQECQTPDKHTSETSQDGDLKGVELQFVAPEINKAPCALTNSDSKPRIEEAVIFVEDSKEPGHADNRSPTNYGQSGVATSSPQQSIIPQESEVSHEELSLILTTASISDTSFSQLQGSPDILEDMDNHTSVTKAKCISESKSNAVSYPAESSSQSTVFIMANIAEDQDGNKTDDVCTSALSAQSNVQNAEASPDPQISNTQNDPVFSEEANDAEVQISGIEPDNNDGSHRCGSSRVLDAPLKETTDAQMNGPQSAATLQTNKPLAPLRVFISEQKSVLPSGFQDLLRSLRVPDFPKSTLKKRGRPLDKAHVSDVHPDRKNNHCREWNAIKETFSEISAEKESRIPISFGSAQPGSPAACSVGNGLRQNCTVTPPPRLHSLGKVSLPVCEDRTPTLLEKEDLQTSDIRSQIAKIEQLLSSEGHRPQKRCRVDEF
ncbi:myosin-3 isoform X2 [Tachysurus fulvidraco]|uniref:myosin-3 isoform X2 n=1 Tax=Tachysurus fulvidraco TaxID=1234273 RepID=UPI001FEEFB8E|nr:myosin-3 isoform X2 [Tachysurus fulvidraco]